MNKLRIFTALLMINLLLCTSVFAHSTSFTNADSSIWESPAKGALEAYNIENKLLSIKTSIQWTSDQIKQFQSENISKQFFPSLVFKADQSDELRSKIMLTDLPGAKFTRYKAREISGEEIKVSILNTSQIEADKAYEFSTAWLHTGSGNPNVTFQSLQGYAQPNGTINDIPNTNHILSTVYLNQAKLIDNKYSDLNLPESIDDPFNQYSRNVNSNVKKKMKSYSIINSKETLDQYKIDAAKLVKALSDDEEVQFAITFSKPVSVEWLAKEYDLSISQIYAVGVTEKKKEYTLSWFDIDKVFLSSMNIGNGLVFGAFGITELEGKAKGEDLIKLSKTPEVDVIDIEENGRIPTGVHWLNTRYEK